MRNLKANLLELIRRTSAELPDDVVDNACVNVGEKNHSVKALAEIVQTNVGSHVAAETVPE